MIFHLWIFVSDDDDAFLHDVGNYGIVLLTFVMILVFLKERYVENSRFEYDNYYKNSKYSHL
jgi:hypothetical protein